MRAHISHNLSRVSNFFVLLSLILYAWALTGTFIENEWTTGHFLQAVEDRVTVTDCYTCIEAFVYAIVFVPVFFNHWSKVSQAGVDGEDLVKLIQQ